MTCLCPKPKRTKMQRLRGEVIAERTDPSPLPFALTPNAQNLQQMPDPVLHRYRAPGNRDPILHDYEYSRRPGTPSVYARQYAMETRPTEAIGPTDLVNPFPRSAAEGNKLQSVDIEWTIVGGPACTAPLQPGWGWIHNYGYITIADTLKPAQQYPAHNYASVDTETVIDRARAAVLRALYGGR